MTTLRPFFLLVGRASVFWIGLATLAFIGIFIAGVSQPDERLGRYVDAAFIALFAFPAAAGWLAGNVIQEAQHTSFLGSLPGVRGRLAVGFAVTGIGVAIVVAGLVSVSSNADQGLALLMSIAFASYCFGGILVDPIYPALSQANVFIALAIGVWSRPLSQLTTAHPWATILLAMSMSGIAFWRLFAVSTFRRKPFRPASPFPGRFYLEHAQRFERDRSIASTQRRRTSWRLRYFGERPGSWLRAAWHESFGMSGPRAIVGSVAKLWSLGLLFLVYAWADMGHMPYLEALGRSTYDALYRSPHLAAFGEKGGPYPVVVMAIATIGAITTLLKPVMLRTGLAYPLSRRQRARLYFNGGLLDGAVVALGVGAFSLGVGFVATRLFSYPFRLDFVPLFFRALLATLVLMPVARAGHLYLRRPGRGLRENSLIAVIFAVVAFVAAVCLWVFLAPSIFGSSTVEVGMLAILLLASQLIFRRWSSAYYAATDLA